MYCVANPYCVASILIFCAGVLRIEKGQSLSFPADAPGNRYPGADTGVFGRGLGILHGPGRGRADFND